MIEQYLKDSIADPVRKAKVEAISKLNLMPPRIYKELRYRDSLMHSKDTSYLLAKGYIKILKDTMNMDEQDAQEALDKLKKLNKRKIKRRKRCRIKLRTDPI